VPVKEITRKRKDKVIMYIIVSERVMNMGKLIKETCTLEIISFFSIKILEDLAIELPKLIQGISPAAT
jgi:hypothetical protein